MTNFDSRLFIAVLIPLTVAVAFTFPTLSEDTGMNSSNYNNPESNNNSSSFPKFERSDLEAGLITNSSFQAQNFEGHASVYVNDFDQDGVEDLMVSDGDNPTLFENVNGSFRKTGFLSEYSNIAAAHFFDHDTSGYSDLLLLRRNDKPVFLENNEGRFKEEDVGFEREFTRPYGALSADYDRDGCMDLLINQWGGDEPMDYMRAKEIYETHPDTRPRLTGYSDFLYQGNCESFSEVTDKAGIVNSSYITFTGSFIDFTDNGYPDLHLANDFARDFFYRNEGDGTFEAVDMGANSDRNAMSSNVADLNGDLEPDIFVTNVYYPENSTENLKEKLLNGRISVPRGNNAFINTEAGFKDRAEGLGVRKGGWGWGSAIADFSNNGHISVIHTTITSHLRLKPSDYWTQLIIFRGKNSGFERINSTKKGFEIDNGRGLAKLDYNNDGNLDLVMSIQTRADESSKPFKLYRNTEEGDFLQVLFDGEGYVETGTELYLNTSEGMQYRILDSGSDMLSQDSPIIHFGLGDAEINSLRSEFPDGETKVFDDLERNTRYRLYRSSEKSEVIFSRGENNE
jgi:hypothetical protein